MFDNNDNTIACSHTKSHEETHSRNKSINASYRVINSTSGNSSLN